MKNLALALLIASVFGFAHQASADEESLAGLIERVEVLAGDLESLRSQVQSLPGQSCQLVWGQVTNFRASSCPAGHVLVSWRETVGGFQRHYCRQLTIQC